MLMVLLLQLFVTKNNEPCVEVNEEHPVTRHFTVRMKEPVLEGVGDSPDPNDILLN